ncbi:hypothetical protein [Actinomadura sp. 6N118]|uniref:hypothetical protein n=1 Tax=Actinomadura sp. 6N118 TaxID=3375151 RepID=UPI0037AE40ED
MHRSVPVLTILVLGEALLLGGCQSPYSYTCYGRRCHVTVSSPGQTVQVNDVGLKVSEISSKGMTVTADGSAPTVIGVGQRTRVGRVTVKVTSADNDKVKFDIDGTRQQVVR